MILNYWNETEEIKKKFFLDRIECRNLFYHKEIYVFGTGRSVHEVQEELSEYAHIIAFIDNNQLKIGNTLYGKNIISLSQYMENKVKKKPIIIMTQLYAREISEQLNEHGLIPGQDYYVWDDKYIFHSNNDIEEYIGFLKKVWKMDENKSRKNIILAPCMNTYNMMFIRVAYFANYFAKKYDAEIYGFSRYGISSLNISENIINLYRACNVKSIVDVKLTEEQQEESNKLCDITWNQLHSWEDWNKIVLYGIPFGATIVSYFLRVEIPCFNLREEKMYLFLKKCINNIVFWYHYIYENSIKAVCLADGVTWEGFIRDIAISKGIPTYVTDMNVCKLSLDWKGIRGQVYPHFEDLWKQLSPKEQEYGLEWAKRQIKKRLQGGVEEVWIAHKNMYTFAEKKKEYKILEDNDKIKVIICPHIFEEECLGCGEQIFDNNYFAWLCHLGELSKKTPEYDWYLKMHPNAHTRDFIIMDMILNKYPKIKRIESDVSPMQLKEEGAAFALTVYGTIGHEFPEIGIQVIHAGNNPHIAFDFTWNPKTKEEYDNLILHLDELNKKVDYEELYKFYCLNYLFYDWDYLSCRNLFFKNPLLRMTSIELNAAGNLKFGTWMYREHMKEWTEKRHQKNIKQLENLIQRADNLRPNILYKNKIDINNSVYIMRCKVKKISLEDMDYDQIVRYFFNLERYDEGALCVELEDAAKQYRFITGIEVFASKDIHELKFWIMGKEPMYEVLSYDGDEVELHLKNNFNGITKEYNNVYKNLKKKGVSVHKVKIPFEKDLMKKSNAGLEKFISPMRRIGQSNEWRYFFEKDLWKFTRYTYDECIEDIPKKTIDKVNTDSLIRIFVVGPCIVEGNSHPLKEKFLNILEKFIKNHTTEYEIIPVQVADTTPQYVCRIYEHSICKNDIVLFLSQRLDDLSGEDLDLTSCYNEYMGDSCLYLDEPIHTTVYGNELIAKEIMDKILLPIIEAKNSNEGRGEVLHYAEVHLGEEDKENLDEYIESVYACEGGDKSIGCIVMNANPYTKGHYHLVEVASSQVDFLYVFVVEEDMSEFSFESRLEMVKEGCKAFHNVCVVPSGKFIISSTTFKNYFEKEEIQEMTIDTSKDVSLFGKYIAPALHITKRFVGEEPFDKVTMQYNEMMKKRLPEYGVELIEIPRVKENDTIVSATLVRKLIKSEDWTLLSQFVPASTLNYIREHIHEDGCFLEKRKVELPWRFENIKNWDEVRKWMASQKWFIIYGTGMDADYMWENNLVDREHVFAFCDKKANTMEYTFKGKEVVKPAELQTKYSDLPILISTRIYNRDIYLELSRSGIDDKRIMILM